MRRALRGDLSCSGLARNCKLQLVTPSVARRAQLTARSGSTRTATARPRQCATRPGPHSQRLRINTSCAQSPLLIARRVSRSARSESPADEDAHNGRGTSSGEGGPPPGPALLHTLTIERPGSAAASSAGGASPEIISEMLHTSAAAAAAAGPSPSSEVAARLARASLDGGRPSYKGREPGSNAWPTGGVTEAAASAVLVVGPSQGRYGPAGARLPASAPSSRGNGGGGVVTIVEFGVTLPASELTSQLVVGPPDSSAGAGHGAGTSLVAQERTTPRLRLCVSPLAGRSADATGRVPVRVGVMEAPIDVAPIGGDGGGRGMRAGALRIGDSEANLLLASPLIWQDEDCLDAHFADVCARVAEVAAVAEAQRRDAFV